MRGVSKSTSLEQIMYLLVPWKQRISWGWVSINISKKTLPCERWVESGTMWQEIIQHELWKLRKYMNKLSYPRSYIQSTIWLSILQWFWESEPNYWYSRQQPSRQLTLLWARIFFRHVQQHLTASVSDRVGELWIIIHSILWTALHKHLVPLGWYLIIFVVFYNTFISPLFIPISCTESRIAQDNFHKMHFIRTS
jgi:hypothetical protein